MFNRPQFAFYDRKSEHPPHGVYAHRSFIVPFTENALHELPERGLCYAIF